MSIPDLLTSLRSGSPFFGAELRPPRAELEMGEGMDAWIDTYHAVRRLTRQGTSVFLTDSAVGTEEEDNLRHLVTNLGTDVPQSKVIPFITAKHSLEHCLSYVDRARQHGFEALVVLGGDKSVGSPRCVEHAWQLRQILRERHQSLALGGWANPHADPGQQVEYLLSPTFNADFYLTQVVSHHDRPAVEQFLEMARRRGVELPGIFGVFYYRSANPRTLTLLKRFLPVPAEALTREFEAGASPEDICGRTIRALLDAGATHFYVSNLPVARAPLVLSEILDRARNGVMW